jgi:diguanylate cyclase (GGDEF)-like protein
MIPAMAEPVGLRVLLVEDNPDDAELMSATLRSSGGHFAVQWVRTLDAALGAIWSEMVDVILLDLALPDSFGQGTLDAVLSTTPTIPVVVMTGLDDERSALQALHAGAQDYLVKGSSDGVSLARALRHAWARRPPGVSSLRSHDPERSRRFVYDEATGLPNHLLYTDRLVLAVARAQRYGDPFALVTVRMDGLETITSTFEADVGNLLLRTSAQRILRRVRRSDTVARIEENAFGLLLERAASPEAVSRHMTNLVEELQRPVPSNGFLLHLQARCGLAFYPQHGTSIEGLMAFAESSLQKVAVP